MSSFRLVISSFLPTFTSAKVKVQSRRWSNDLINFFTRYLGIIHHPSVRPSDTIRLLKPKWGSNLEFSGCKPNPLTTKLPCKHLFALHLKPTYFSRSFTTLVCLRDIFFSDNYSLPLSNNIF